MANRSAWSTDRTALWIDLADPQWRSVRLTAGDWTVVENPPSLFRRFTHQQPLHADTLKLLVQAAGFAQVDVQFRQPVRASDRLERVAPVMDAAPELAQIAAVLNDHAEKLNARIFSFMDYVVVARR